MQETSGPTNKPQNKGTLFPDLAPYGIARPPLAPQVKKEPAVVAETEFMPDPRMVVPPVAEATEAVPSVAVTKRHKKGMLIALVAGVLLMSTGGFLLLKEHKQPVKTADAQTTDPQITIPLYHPESLASGFTYNNDSKTIKKDVYYFSISGPNNQKFYVTEQPIPVNFDFTAFNKKFLNPDNFNAPAGTVTAGPVGGSLIASIRTVKNTWVIINATPSASLSSLESVVRSLQN